MTSSRAEEPQFKNACILMSHKLHQDMMLAAKITNSMKFQPNNTGLEKRTPKTAVTAITDE
jgi:hypothetical protein